MADTDKKVALFNMDKTATIGMTEVVNVFVARYENALRDEKARLTDKISAARDELNRLVNDTSESFKALAKEKHEFTLEAHNIQAVMDRVVVDFEKSTCYTTLFISDINTNHKNRYGYGYGNSRGYERIIEDAISEETMSKHNALMKEIADLSNDLSKVLVDIRDVGWRERQIRAKISERELTEAGYSALIEDDELLKLCEL